VSGDTVVLGAPLHQVGLSQEGAAYVYVGGLGRFFGKRTQTAELTPSDGATNDEFGFAVGVSGDLVVVGSLGHQVGPNEGQGAAYLFAKPGDTWKSITETEELTAPDGAASDVFGAALSISGNTVVAAAPLHRVGTNEDQGALYVLSPAPSVAIDSPADGATFTPGQAVNAAYACTATAGSTITTCLGPVASGAPIDTSGLGPHTFTVTAATSDGVTATRGVSYTVVRAAVRAAPPSITAVRQSASVWRERGKHARGAGRRKRPVGTTFSFRLDQPATVALRFKRRGHKAGTLTRAGHAGANHVRFAGRLSAKKRLAPGRYTVRITATNSAGRRSSSRRLKFRIAK
jgi:hypothetical protein